MMSSKYFDAADSLVQLLLKQTDDAYGDNVFSSNVHSIDHLACKLETLGLSGLVRR